MSIIRVEQIEKREYSKICPNNYEWVETIVNKYFLGIKYYSKVHRLNTPPEETKGQKCS